MVTSVGVGKGVSAATTSENGTEFVLGNTTGGDIVVLNSTFGTQIGPEILVDRNVTQLVVDPRTGNVYCWTSISRVIEIVNLSTNTALAAAPGTVPQLVSISSPIGESRIFASAGNGSLVYPLGSLTLRESSPRLVTSSAALSVVTDSSSDRLYVGTAAGLKVYNSTTDQLITSVSGLSGEDSQLLLDQTDNLLWLVDSLSGVSAVYLATNQVAFPTMGLSPLAKSGEAIAVDPGNLEAFVLVTSSAVAVLNSLTGHVVNPAITVGLNVTSIVYDPVDHQVYSAGDQVSLLNTSSLLIDGGPILLGGSHKVLGEVYEPSRTGIFIATVGLLSGQQGSVSELDGASIWPVEIRRRNSSGGSSGRVRCRHTTGQPRARFSNAVGGQRAFRNDQRSHEPSRDHGLRRKSIDSRPRLPDWRSPSPTRAAPDFRRLPTTVSHRAAHRQTWFS